MGKNMLVSMLIMSMLLNVAVGFLNPLKNVANQAQKGVQDIAKQAFGRKTLEEIAAAQLQAPGDCDEGKLIHNPHDALGVTDKGLELGKDRGVEFTDQKTPEENGGEQACDQGPAQNLAGNILDGAKNIPRQPAN
ncbi:hypothetical protein AB3S75_041137 [Citrus x aurantiifolia]